MRQFFTSEDAFKRGISAAQLKWGAQRGRWRRIWRDVYGDGPEPPSSLDRAVAVAVATGGVASGALAGVLHELDSVRLGRGPVCTVDPAQSRRRPGVRGLRLAPERVVVVDGLRCTDGTQTLIDLAPHLDDLRWEQALESALRNRLTSIPVLETLLPVLGEARTPGVTRMRTVLALRPSGAPPTESLLETLMVQLLRGLSWPPAPVRQVEVHDQSGVFVARVDLAWPDLGLFLELDGQHHAGQPVYDARRETSVVAATGWLPGRFTWHEVVRVPRATLRRVEALAAQARRVHSSAPNSAAFHVHLGL